MEAMRPDGLSSIRQVLPSTGIQEVPGGAPLILYINKNGVTLSPGDNDARTNKSTLVSQTTAVPAWTTTATAWTQIMNCTRTMWAPFNVTVTDVDPGNVPHMESIVTTLSSTIGMDPNVGGVSPYTIGCDFIPNSIVFTFAQAFNGDPETICEVMGQEMAHSIGHDHQMLASDPMTYLEYNGLQAFRDQTVSCGEYQNRACGLQGECGATQNSVQLMLTRVGAAGGGGTDGIPTVAITSPANGAQVRPGFRVDVDADDDGSVTKVELFLDGTLADTKTTAPFSFTTATSMSMGAHSVETVVTDNTGQTSSEQINVTITNDAPPQDPPDDPDDPSDPSGDPGELVSGCQAGGGASGGGLALLGLALLGLVVRRRR
jgi:MYXO-CTERM domain-containing protein